MAKKKSPSREKYDEENPAISFRVPKQLKEQLEKYLAASGQSFADFAKSVLDGEQTLINERLNARVEQRFGAFKNRVEAIDNLMFQLLCTFYDKKLPVLCPRCEDKWGYRLLSAVGLHTGTDGKTEDYPTWKCPHCGWFYDIYGSMNPASIKWDEPVDALTEAQKKMPPKK